MPQKSSYEDRTSSSDEPLVTVIIPTFDRGEYLKEAVASVLNQTYDNIELIIVDDHSPKPAAGSLASMASDDDRIHIIRHSDNRGANAARNTGLDRATGEFVAFLDDDDWWEPEKVEKQVQAFRESSEDVGIVYTNQKLHTGSNTRVRNANAEGDLTKALLLGNPVGGFSTVMVRREAIKDAGYPNERFSPMGDKEWYIRLSVNWSFKPIHEPLVNYRANHGTGAPQISQDLDRIKNVSFPLLEEEYEQTAKQYGLLFSRKMKANLAFEISHRAYFQDDFSTTRRYAARAIRYYPFAWEFYMAFIMSFVGNWISRLPDILPRSIRGRSVRAFKRFYFDHLR